MELAGNRFLFEKIWNRATHAPGATLLLSVVAGLRLWWWASRRGTTSKDMTVYLTFILGTARNCLGDLVRGMEINEFLINGLVQTAPHPFGAATRLRVSSLSLFFCERCPWP